MNYIILYLHIKFSIIQTLTSMKTIKMIQGTHLTQTERRHISTLIEQGYINVCALMNKRKIYIINPIANQEGFYNVRIQENRTDKFNSANPKRKEVSSYVIQYN